MENLWNVFSTALSRNISKANIDSVYKTKNYIDSFSASYSISDEQKKMMQSLFYLLLEDNKAVTDIKEYFGFLFPISELEKALTVHEQTINKVKEKSETSLKEKIITCFENNLVNEELVNYIQANSRSKNALILTLAFSYIANENQNAFPINRQLFLSLYQRTFKTDNIYLKKDLFITTNLLALEKFNKISKELETNNLLRLSYFIAGKQTVKNIGEFVEEIENIYNDLIDIFSTIKTKMDEQQEENICVALT